MRVSDFVNAEIEISGAGANVKGILDKAAETPATAVQHASCGGATFPVFGAPKFLCRVAQHLLFFGEIKVHDDPYRVPPASSILANTFFCTSSLPP